MTTTTTTLTLEWERATIRDAEGNLIATVERGYLDPTSWHVHVMEDHRVRVVTCARWADVRALFPGLIAARDPTLTHGILRGWPPEAPR